MTNATQYIIVYLLSIFGGHFVMVGLMALMRWTTGQKAKIWDWSVLWIGGTERAIATTLVIFAPPYVGVFIGAWVAFKIAAGWQRERNSPATRTGTMLALVGSAFSFAIAIGTGLLINPGALQLWTTTK